MNKIQIDVQRMATAALQLLNNNSEMLTPFNVITKQKSKIETLLEEVEFHKKGQEEGDTTAKTQTKNELLMDLIDRTAKIALKARGLAKITGDNDLLKKVDYSRYEIATSTDQYTLDTIEKILKAAKDNQQVLIESYNLNKSEIAALEKIMERVDALIDKRRVSISGGKASTANLSESINELREAWDVMDDFILGIIDDEDFIETYTNTRN